MAAVPAPAESFESRERCGHDRRQQQIHRPVRAAPRGPAAGARARAVCRRYLVSPPASHAHSAFSRSTWADRVGRCARGAGDPRGACRLDRGRHRRHSADRFPRRPHREARALSPAGAGARARALCRRAGRGGVRGRSLCRRGCRRSRRDRDRGIAGAARCRCGAGRILNRARDRSGDRAPGLWRHRRHDGARPSDRRRRSRGRPPFRRADRDARRHRPPRQVARHRRAVRRGEGAAPHSRAVVALAAAAAVVDPHP